MRQHANRSTWARVVLSVLTLNNSSHSAGAGLMPVSKAELCVTEGSIEESGGRLSVNVPKMRAFVKERTPQIVEAHFTYLGSTGNEARLGSGELRRQFGLKLRAEDSCNLVYAMWRIEPESKLVVSVKTNPGQHTSAQCGNRGYRNIKPAKSKPVAALRSGETHTLRAEMNGDQMKVFADNSLVWEGSVGADALAFDGPVGIRSDNARLQLELRTGEPLNPQPAHATECRAGESD
jgi:hypothetical protein